MFILLSADPKSALSLTKSRLESNKSKPSLNEILAWTSWGFQVGKSCKETFTISDSINLINKKINSKILEKAIVNGLQQGLQLNSLSKHLTLNIKKDNL